MFEILILVNCHYIASESKALALADLGSKFGGLGAEPPPDSMGSAPGQGIRGRSTPEAESVVTPVDSL